VHCKPWGLEGGGDGAGNELAIRSNGKWQESFNNAKFIFDIKKEGDAFRIRAGGGGGYGNPWERPIEKVREDVRQGYVSVKAAEELYGVMIDAVSFIVDVRATEKKRAEMAKAV
jgi:N-methylhydantoinase B